MVTKVSFNSRGVEPAGHDRGDLRPALGGFLNRSLDKDLVAFESGFIEALHARQIPIENLQLGRQSVGEVVLFDERLEKIRKSRRLEFILVRVIKLGILLRQRKLKHFPVDIKNPEHVIEPDLILIREKLLLDDPFKLVNFFKNTDVNGVIEAHVTDIGKHVRVLRP
ncbi:MAG: hypothetical protein BWY44_01191 [Candidatus Omnitrophica bacterium ADurb.Bin292]|nr:MAG: hypothetical protein BWY44_01191 [Candidatus Omnitrophica bacterium ADurb.Bin292]